MEDKRMVWEKRLVLEIDDIKGVLCRCGNCREEILLSVAGSRKLPHNCPICNSEWMDRYESDPKPEAQILAVLQLLRKRKDDGRVKPLSVDVLLVTADERQALNSDLAK